MKAKASGTPSGSPSGTETIIPQREFTRFPDGRYVLALPGEAIRFEVARLRWSHHELWGQLSVECRLAGARTVDGRTLHVADFNLSSAAARVARAKILAEAARIRDVDWTRLIEELSQRTLTAETLGDPAVRLVDVPLSDPDDEEHEIMGLRILKRDHTMIVSDGGIGKSRLACFVSGELAARGERVLIVDYETHEREWRKRAGAMFDPISQNLFYLRASAPLIAEVERIRREITTRGITYVWIDSVAPGCHGKPEDSDIATAYMQAARRFGVGVGHLAHVPKSAEKGSERPFGSQFWWNLPRSIWVLEAQKVPDRLIVACHHRKSNNSALYPAVGFQFAFTPDTTIVSSRDIRDVPELAESLPLWQRMREAIRSEPKTLAALANELGATVDTLDRTVRRGKGTLFTRVCGSDGITRISLVERRQE